MSDLVQFPLEDYDRNAFSSFRTTNDYTPGNALAMMWFAQLAYEVDTSGANATAAKIDAIRTRFGFEPVTTFRGQAVSLRATFNTTGVFGERTDAVVLAFAGTDPAVLETVVTDFTPRIDPAKHTHTGFQAAFDAVIAHVDAAIALSRQSRKPLLVSGHSLGAALAALAALHAVQAGTPPMAVYGYGMPRVGNGDFQTAYNAALGRITYRHVHGRDIVARVPLNAMGYRHVGRVIACDADATFGAATLSPAESDEPDATLDYLRQLLPAVSLQGGANLLAGLALGGAPTQQTLLTAFSRMLQPPGLGPLGPWFRLLPPPIRDHLQDRYIKALS